MRYMKLDLAGCCCLALILGNVAIADELYDVATDEVTYSDAGGQKAVGYFARPEKDGKCPAIVLIHEWWGQNKLIAS